MLLIPRFNGFCLLWKRDCWYYFVVVVVVGRRLLSNITTIGRIISEFVEIKSRIIVYNYSRTIIYRKHILLFVELSWKIYYIYYVVIRHGMEYYC